MYKAKYTFWNDKLYPGFRDMLDRVYNDSRENYLNTHINPDKKELEVFDKFLNDLEQYYALLDLKKIITEKNRNNILERLNSLELIVVPKINKKNMYGATLGNQISINPLINAEHGLSSNMMMQLSVSHELGHLINNKWKSDADELSSYLYNDPNNRELMQRNGISDSKYLNFGFDLLDEVVAEEAAEVVTYDLAKRKKNEILNHNPYISDHVFYNELYPYAYDFIKELDYVSKGSKDSELFLRLIRRSFDSDFIKEIGKEIMSSDREKRERLITMLACMGKIKAACYQSVGLNKDIEYANANRYIELFNDIKRR